MGKHTPGPWLAVKTLDGRWRVDGDPQDEYPPVARMAEQPEAEANARLIASAPTMHALLRRALPVLRAASEGRAEMFAAGRLAEEVAEIVGEGS